MAISLSEPAAVSVPRMNQFRASAATAAPPLRALVLLAGSVRPSHLSKSIGRSLLDLPVDEGLSVLQLWEAEAQRLADAAGLPELPVRVVLDRAAVEPTRNGAGSPIRLTLEREASEFRGTGGVLRDVAIDYNPDELLLVASAGQILIEPLHELANDLFGTCGDVALIGHADGTPGAMFLVSCRVLAALRDIGFLDFKEQVLPRLSTVGASVRVVQRPMASGFPVRTLDSYLAGLRAYHRARQGKPIGGDPFAEDWSPTFAIIEPGASVDPTATVHDSVVLSGGRVERGAVVVRSIVCPGAVVPAGETIAGQVVAPERTPRKPR
jgi:hypothetical protein